MKTTRCSYCLNPLGAARLVVHVAPEYRNQFTAGEFCVDNCFHRSTEFADVLSVFWKTAGNLTCSDSKLRSS